ncbi:MAG: antitoxin [Dehalococcoidia bacterium]|nr:antitoxin [Dehalococcoidia bacterium]
MSLSAWLRAAARERLQARQRVKVFESPDDVREFFRSCAALDGPETEPDWDEHLRVMNESRRTGVTGT